MVPVRVRLVFAMLFIAQGALADAGGVSFWLPGNYGSFAATPTDPGWSLPLIYYYSAGDEHGSRNSTRGGRITAGVDARAGLLFAIPTYTFAAKVAGGQAAVSVGAAISRRR